ncbi:hypothetical protein CXG81DRAFT_28141 [Caulochytrium protostelioides]|uniref:Uncharacterized protein n=1 Tax=Caulochytrium protostelioides TaxID=1555241 RepID=A0A4P9WZV3_9FUNG|nr:hypothetical protein CXG81DRAFT_28141 [Caulochytrium protostelioides]|eukprot:RKO99074.1 hypothetical protein CXG81DRAFT_28141 [Caulochytrium protostelioides]
MVRPGLFLFAGLAATFCYLDIERLRYERALQRLKRLVNAAGGGHLVSSPVPSSALTPQPKGGPPPPGDPRVHATLRPADMCHPPGQIAQISFTDVAAAEPHPIDDHEFGLRFDRALAVRRTVEYAQWVATTTSAAADGDAARHGAHHDGFGTSSDEIVWTVEWVDAPVPLDNLVHRNPLARYVDAADAAVAAAVYGVGRPMTATALPPLPPQPFRPGARPHRRSDPRLQPSTGDAAAAAAAAAADDDAADDGSTPAFVACAAPRLYRIEMALLQRAEPWTPAALAPAAARYAAVHGPRDRDDAGMDAPATMPPALAMGFIATYDGVFLRTAHPTDLDVATALGAFDRAAFHARMQRPTPGDVRVRFTQLVVDAGMTAVGQIAPADADADADADAEAEQTLRTRWASQLGVTTATAASAASSSPPPPPPLPLPPPRTTAVPRLGPIATTHPSGIGRGIRGYVGLRPGLPLKALAAADARYARLRQQSLFGRLLLGLACVLLRWPRRGGARWRQRASSSPPSPAGAVAAATAAATAATASSSWLSWMQWPAWLSDGLVVAHGYAVVLWVPRVLVFRADFKTWVSWFVLIAIDGVVLELGI